ncbi:MAG: hypothetical protein R3D62_05105 [Xanthobacteraceae bacterium]
MLLTPLMDLNYREGASSRSRTVYAQLQSSGISVQLPTSSSYTILNTFGTIKAIRVLFIGVNALRQFQYKEIRDFARKVLSSLAAEASDARHLALTIHGPGYGLDEIEAFESEVAGIVDAVSTGDFPKMLESVTFVEQNEGRARRLSDALKRLVPTGRLPIEGSASDSKIADEVRNTLRDTGYASARKPHVFVAMPFAAEMDDVFHYGIQGAANAAGLLCERADLSVFTGDVVEWVKNRISSATLVVADLSSANPNVYLEVGYAWGRQVPTVLLAKEVNDLKFDVKGQRCIMYKSIKELETALSRELVELSKRHSYPR